MDTNWIVHKHISFLEMYQEKIAPVFKKIDLMLKTSGGFLTETQVSEALNISADEINQIMAEKKLCCLNIESFLTVMELGSSYICNIYKRELECGSPYVYSPENIAYIYGIDISAVCEACVSLGVKEITAYTLPDVMAQITIYTD